MFTFVRKVQKNRKREYLILFFIMTLLASFEFCSLAMYSSLSTVGENPLVQGIINVFPTLTTFIALILTVFIIKYFINTKKQEFSILLLSGRKPKDLFIYILYQFGLLAFISFIIGIGIGYLFIIIINIILRYYSLGYLFHIIWIQTIFLYLCFLIFTVIFIVVTCSHQFVELDKNVILYLNHKKVEKKKYKIMLSASSSTSQKRKPILSILSTLFILYITIYSLMKVLDTQLEVVSLFQYYAFILVGMIYIVNSTIPLLYDLLHHHLLNKPTIINALSCFNDFSTIMITLVNLNACLVPTMMMIVFLTGQDMLLQIIIIPCFVMVLMMIGLCFILRYALYDESIRSIIATYFSIGYNPRQLKLILFFKNIIFAIFAIMIPLLLFDLLSYRAYIGNYLSLEVLIGLSVVYMVMYLLILIYILVKERKMLKEVTNHVKYLNRG